MVEYNVSVYNLPNSIEKDRFSLRGFTTKRVVTVYPNCNNVLPTRFVINCIKTGLCYKMGCNCLSELL